jgi:hypothetical protein
MADTSPQPAGTSNNLRKVLGHCFKRCNFVSAPLAHIASSHPKSQPHPRSPHAMMFSERVPGLGVSPLETTLGTCPTLRGHMPRGLTASFAPAVLRWPRRRAGHGIPLRKWTLRLRVCHGFAARYVIKGVYCTWNSRDTDKNAGVKKHFRNHVPAPTHRTATL